MDNVTSSKRRKHFHSRDTRKFLNNTLICTHTSRIGRQTFENEVSRNRRSFEFNFVNINIEIKFQSISKQKYFIQLFMLGTFFYPPLIEPIFFLLCLDSNKLGNVVFLFETSRMFSYNRNAEWNSDPRDNLYNYVCNLFASIFILLFRLYKRDGNINCENRSLIIDCLHTNYIFPCN